MTGGNLRIGGILDRYVARLFGASYLAAFFLVVGLFVVLEMAVELDDYLEPREGLPTPGATTVLRYYSLMLPFYYLEMSPFVTLVAGLFTAARLARRNEVVGVLGAGVSSRRLYAPVLAGAVVLAAGMLVLREWATDELGTERDRVLDFLEERRPHPVYSNLWVKDPAGRRARIDEYLARPEEEGGPVIRGLTAVLRHGDRTVDLRAESATDPRREDGRWTWSLEGGKLYVTDAKGQRVEAVATLELVDFGPEDVQIAWRAREAPLELSGAQVRDLLERDPSNLQIRTVAHYLLTFPLAGIVLLLVGLPFFVGQERGRAAERVALGFLLCVIYFGVDFVMRTLGLQGAIGPVHAAWFPIVLFGSLGGALFATMRS